MNEPTFLNLIGWHQVKIMAEKRPQRVGLAVPPRPQNVSPSRWLGMLRYYGTHHASTSKENQS